MRPRAVQRGRIGADSVNASRNRGKLVVRRGRKARGLARTRDSSAAGSASTPTRRFAPMKSSSRSTAAAGALAALCLAAAPAAFAERPADSPEHPAHPAHPEQPVQAQADEHANYGASADAPGHADSGTPSDD